LSGEDRIKWHELCLTLAIAVLPSHAWAAPSALYGVSCVTQGANATTGPDATGNNFICDSGSTTWLPPAYQFGNSASSCSTTVAGTLRWTGSDFQDCDGGGWSSLLNVTTPNVQVFTTPGANTYTWSSSYTFIDVYICGAGGGGGNGGGNASGQSAGAGGGGGECVDQVFKGSDVAGNVTVTIGTGGIHSVAGGNSTFGSFRTAYGGGGGQVSQGNNTSTGGNGGDLMAAGTTSQATNGFGGGAPNGQVGSAPTSPYAGAGGGSSLNSSVAGKAGGNSWLGGPGGGGGGSGGGNAGGNGGQSVGCPTAPSGGAGGGANPGGSTAASYNYLPGCGGGGGGSLTGGTGGVGGAGTNAGGGGGGGDGSGVGGQGGNGFAVVKSW
jgi:hypothetical protein